MLGGKLEKNREKSYFLTKKPSITPKITFLAETTPKTTFVDKASNQVHISITKQNPAAFTKTIENYFQEITKTSINYKKLPRDKNGKILPIGNWHLSISHSENYLAIAIANGKNIAIDLEKSTHQEKLTSRLLKKILAPGELEVNGSYLNNYVIKESYLKYLGTGLSAGLGNYDANNLLKDPTLSWQDLSTEEYSCFVITKS